MVEQMLRLLHDFDENGRCTGCKHFRMFLKDPGCPGLRDRRNRWIVACCNWSNPGMDHVSKCFVYFVDIDDEVRVELFFDTWQDGMNFVRNTILRRPFLLPGEPRRVHTPDAPIGGRWTISEDA